MTKLTKVQRKELQQKISQAEKTVKEAKKILDPLKALPSSFVELQTNQQHSFKFTYYESLTDSPLILSSCLHLFEMNMGDLYKRSSWGLNMKQKERDFTHDDSRFIIVHNPLDKEDILAFGLFRFEVDEDTHEEILYIYELQVKHSIQRCGVGKRLMFLMEMIAFTVQMKKIMLTVFSHNQAAMSFYINKMKYIIDPSSPSNWNEQEPEDYEILSKTLRKPT